MSKFTKHNLDVIKSKFKGDKSSGIASDNSIRLLGQIADYVMKEQYGNIPVDTHNLAEGTGIGIYSNGVLRSFRYPSTATVPRRKSWGKNQLSRALSAGSTRFADGLWIVAFSTQPYARYVRRKGSTEERGAFFTEDFVGEFKTQVLRHFKLH